MKKIRDIGSNLITFLGALVPVFKSCPPCPICMPKYAAIFAFFGLELADYSQYLAPIMVTSMVISLVSMFYQVHIRKLKYYTFVCAFFSSVLLLVSKFIFDNTLMAYIFMGTLIASVIYHYHYIQKNADKKCCPAKEYTVS